MRTTTWRLGRVLNWVQSTFISFLRISSVPLVVMLSVASGYTTYYGMLLFITWWIALIITIAVQSIIVVCSLELASLHWRANRARYLNVACSLAVALGVSISFSYFKFFEMFETEDANISIQNERLKTLQEDVNTYLNKVLQVQSDLLSQQRNEVSKAKQEADKESRGERRTPSGEFSPKGQGLSWRTLDAQYQAEEQQLTNLKQGVGELDQKIRTLRETLNNLVISSSDKYEVYELVSKQYLEVHSLFDEQAKVYGHPPLQPPELQPYAQFIQPLKPSSLAIEHFSPLAFVYATMVDFFTFLLSYRLESTAPGPLNEHEQNLAYQCLTQFTQWKINRNDQLEVIIEKTEVERARKFPDWMRMFGAAFLLSRGYLRKVSHNSVEFAPNLYPVITERLKEEPNATNSPTLSDSRAENGKVNKVI